MRIILAVGHLEMQRYFARDCRAEVTAIVDSGEELIDMLAYVKGDVIVLSKTLKYNGTSMQLVELISEMRKDIKIVYLYGEEDGSTKSFINFLHSKSIYHYHLGANISSVDLNRLIFGEIEPQKKSIWSLWKPNNHTMPVRELDSAVITLYSNSSNGKSHTAWNLAYAFGERGYRTTLINLDRGYSANILFGIEDIYHDLLDYMVSKNDYQGILESCFRTGNISVIAGRLGSEERLNSLAFQKLLYIAKAKSDIVILDTLTGIDELTMEAIKSSSIDFLIFDCDLMHFHMNKLMLEKMKGLFIPEKTIAVINNCPAFQESYKFIYRELQGMNLHFKDILPLSSCGSLSCDLMYTNKSPYTTINDKSSSYCADMNTLLQRIHARDKIEYTRIKSKWGSAL